MTRKNLPDMTCDRNLERTQREPVLFWVTLFTGVKENERMSTETPLKSLSICCECDFLIYNDVIIVCSSLIISLLPH